MHALSLGSLSQSRLVHVSSPNVMGAKAEDEGEAKGRPEELMMATHSLPLLRVQAPLLEEVCWLSGISIFKATCGMKLG